MRALRYLTELPREKWPLIIQLAETMWDGTTAEEILQDIARQGTTAWECGDALVLTQIVKHPRGLELYLYGIVGEGILAVAEDVVEDLKEIAGVLGCKMIGAFGIPVGWERVTRKLGFERVAVRYLMEMEDGLARATG